MTTPASTSISRQIPLNEINQKIQSCRKCHLSETRTNAVPGEGSSNATIVIVGEGPGRQEDLEGRPFVGRAGRLLDEFLVSTKIDRKSVYITNIVKCRASTRNSNETALQQQARDRKPTGEEIAACAPYLEEQMRIIEPQIICTLGDTATQFILEKHGLKTGNISKIHGRTYPTGRVKIVPMYHPAAALYTAELKDVIKKDFRRLSGLLSQTTLESIG